MRRLPKDGCPRIWLLDIDPSHQGPMTRRIFKIEVNGKSEWRKFDEIRWFVSEAMRYAAGNGITDLALSQ